MIRYLTGDRARLVEKPCACGKRFSLEIRGRKEDSIAVGDRLLDLPDLESIVSRLPCRRFWAVAPIQGGVHVMVEKENDGDILTPELVQQLETEYNMKLRIELVPKGTLYDRYEMITVGLMGKPKYIYTESPNLNSSF